MTVTQLKYIDGSIVTPNPGKIVCVGRNYLEHIRELNNETPSEAVLFMKPSTALIEFENTIPLVSNKGEVHHELELCLLIGESLKNANPDDCLKAIKGYGLALDLTLRALQTQLKQKGLPWERAKAFDGSCPITSLVACKNDFRELHHFSMYINGELRQMGDTQKMIRTMANLISEISHWFSLEPGDLILTGTPEGVGVLKQGDAVLLELDEKYHWTAVMGQA